jgi:hypothetical protein
MNIRPQVVFPALVVAGLMTWNTPAHADENQCPPEVMDCGCGTDPSCPGVDLSAYYIDDTCDPEVDPSCDQLRRHRN